jgi:hypothetical protein
MTLDCRETCERLGGWIDGQLEADAARQLETHLAECASCRQEADAQRREHEQLAAALAPRREAAQRVAERVIAQLSPAVAAAQRPADVAPRPSAAMRSVVQWLIAAAAGFLLAVAVFRPWETRVVVAPPDGSANRLSSERPNERPIEVTPAHFARLAVATGPVEYAPDGGMQFFACPDSAPLGRGAKLRTSESARCEVELPQSARIRLNQATQMRFAGERRIELDEGRLWLDIRQATEPYVIGAAGVEISADTATLDCSVAPPAVELLVLEGGAIVKGGDWEQPVSAGERLSFSGGRPTLETPFIDPIVETRWVHDILIEKGPQDAELCARIERLWAQVGQAKLKHLYEAEIRSLGARSVRPLASFINSPESLQDPNKRAAAARLLADVAQVESIPLLIGLLLDESGEVRLHSARALERLTGENFGRKPEDWQAASWSACQPTAVQWQAWWDGAKQRYPGVKDQPAWQTKEKLNPPQRKS